MEFPDQKFPLGKVVSTPGALDRFSSLGLDYLARHASGDWGDLSPEDSSQNEINLVIGERLFSTYNTPEGPLWIITERDRSFTTLLLPEEY